MPQGVIAGRYRFDREVGRGGMGSVWLCRDERLGREVAVKQVGGLPGESSMHLARALREARHSAALNHPNVVAIYDALEEGDHVWLVMEYVPSRTLDEMVREDGPLDPAHAARICADVADGLAAAHALGTVHRDVKPSNILVRAADGRALIADFGIARTVGQEQLTRSGLVTGTPVYFAPELARGEEPSPASDVWALGVSVYVAVEGHPPYPDQSNAIALLNTIASQPPPEPTRAGPLGPALERMLDPNPEARWSMAHAAEALREVAGSAKPTPPPPSDRPVAVDRQPTRAAATRAVRTPVPPPVPASAPTLEPTPVAEATPEATRVEEPVPVVEPVAEPVALAPEPGSESPRRRGLGLLAAAVTVLALAIVGGWWLSRDTDNAPDTGRTAAGTTEPSGEPSQEPPGDESEPGQSEAGENGSEQPQPDQSEPDAPSTTSASSPSSSTDGDSADGSAAAVVTSYYSLLPEDVDRSWQLLAPSLQDEIGRGSFVGFWATIDDVRVDSAEEVGDGLVQVTITYTSNGRTEQETRRLAVQSSGAGLLITDDLGAV